MLSLDIRQAATKQNNSAFLSLWAGTNVHLIRKDSATNIMQALVNEMESSK